MIKTPEPNYNSKLTDIIIQLEHLRGRSVSSSTSQQIFVQLKNLFHIIEALSSARIEGNHTTLAGFVEKRARKSENVQNEDESMKEIINLMHALDFIDEHIAAIDAKRKEDGKASVEDFEKGDIDWPKFNTELSLPYGGYKFQVSNSGIHGLGLLACGDIKKDEYIGHAWTNGKPTQIAQYVNHGVNPNAMIDEHGAMWALRDIKGNYGGELGEELTVDYRSCIWLA